VKKFFGFTLSFVIVLFIGNAQANLIVSGDANIINPLIANNGYNIPVDVGNQQFFTNVLNGGTNVMVLNGDLFDAQVNQFYNSLTGVTSNNFSGTVTATDLAGIDLFVSALPSDNFTASEISVLSDYLDNGGNIFFLGENNNFPIQNARINNVLSALGSGIRIQDDIFDAGFHTAIGAQIANDPLTVGVQTFTYAAPSQTVVNGGTALFFGTGGQTFVACEGARNVPEPSILALLSLGLVGLAGIKRKKR
jgi:hypothetical protein